MADRDDTWVTGRAVARSGLAAYTHLIRSPDDPQRLERGSYGSTAWRGALADSKLEEWKSRLLTVLSDGQARTFNALVLTASGGRYTADVAFKKAPDKALWALVEGRMVEHTRASPVLFRLRQ